MAGEFLEFLEFLEDFDNYHQIHPRPRIQRPRPDWFNNYDELDFFKRYRYRDVTLVTIMTDTLKLNLQFGGGAELLFDKIKKREVELPALHKYLPDCQHEKWTIGDLLVWIKDNLLKERPELFLQGDSVRPGILVLINDADWELSGELEYELQNKDTIMFISTLHGG